uniref:Sushi domain-containing protein n=1 Tax=Catharus ustulatus TaxID=91951 RepID=A0A8C3TXP1_CATUS
YLLLSSLNPPYPHGTQATYNCRPGYVKIGRVAFRCDDGVWKQLAPVVECRNKPCGHPGDTEYGFFELTSGSEFVFGARVEYRCNDGYQMLSQRNYRECHADGWSNDIPHCEEISCDVPEIPHGYVRSPKRSYKENEIMQFFCKEGYKYGNRADALCTESGWNPPPYCIEIICFPPEISSGNFRPQKDKYTLGNTISVECDAGYHFKVMTGSGATAECTKNGWTPEPACVRKPCDYPVIENGRLSSSYEYNRYYYFPRRFGETVDYYCLNDYSTPTGAFWVRITCSEMGWSPQPKCLKKCFVRELENGYFPGWNDFYKEGERARYVCHNDYQAQHKEVTCTRNGWAPPPRCIRTSECACILVRFLSKTICCNGNSPSQNDLAVNNLTYYKSFFSEYKTEAIHLNNILSIIY